MTIRQKLPITGVIEKVYVIALMQIYSITTTKNNSLEVNENSEEIKQSIKDARKFANAKISEYNDSLNSPSGIVCEDLIKLLMFADELIQSIYENDYTDLRIFFNQLESEIV